MLTEARCNKAEEKQKEWFQITAILLASMISFSYGLMHGWSSPAIPQIIADKINYNIDLEEASYFTVLPPIGMILSSWVYQRFTDKYGRKWAILSIAVPHTISWIIVSSATSVYALYAARLLGGLGDAGIFMSLPAYVGEVTTPKVRGTWGNVVSLVQYIAMFFMNVLGAVTDIRTASWICAATPVLFIVTFIFMPESPYYYLMKGEEEQARRSLQRLRCSGNVEDELVQLKLDVERQLSESGTWRDLFGIESNRRAIYAALFLRISQQFSGISSFETYTRYIFIQAGGESDDSASVTISTLVTSAFCATLTFIASCIMDRFGRRKSYIFSCFFSGLMLAVLVVYFYLQQFTDVEMDSTILSWIPLIGTVLYYVFFSCGMGLMPTLMLGELFSSSIKGKALCFLNYDYALMISSTSKIFQVMESNLGLFAPFLLFSLSCFLSSFLSLYLIPETKGKTLEEIQQGLKKNKN